MYYDEEGHAIATNIGDAASTMTPHEQAAYFGYDCTSRCCQEPTWEKPCDRCGTTVARWRGQRDVDCDRCGASYNAGGQRLRDNWRNNSSLYDDEVDDLEGYERAALREDWEY